MSKTAGDGGEDWLTKLEKLIFEHDPAKDLSIQDFLTQFIKPLLEAEFTRRSEAGIMQKDMEIRRILIKFQSNGPPIIEFNNEIGVEAIVRTIPEVSFNEEREQVSISHIREILKVNRPTIDGKIVPYIYMHYLGAGYLIIPNFSAVDGSQVDNESGLTADQALTIVYQSMIQEKVMHQAVNLKALRRIGLWPIPSLIIYPLNRIIEQLIDHDENAARSTLVSYCTPKFIEDLCSKWCNIESFAKRSNLFKDALDAHKNGKYRLSIYSLLPQIEGTISDWAYAESGGNIRFRQISKTKTFRDLILDRPSSFIFNAVVESTVDFILKGPVLKDFKKWSENIDNTFPNRNVVGHGKYDDSLFTEENSIKLFLLLDTIYTVMARASQIKKS